MRFEVMPRLEWVEVVPEADVPGIDLVWRAERLGAGFGQEAPALAAEPLFSPVAAFDGNTPR